MMTEVDGDDHENNNEDGADTDINVTRKIGVNTVQKTQKPHRFSDSAVTHVPRRHSQVRQTK